MNEETKHTTSAADAQEQNPQAAQGVEKAAQAEPKTSETPEAEEKKEATAQGTGERTAPTGEPEGEKERKDWFGKKAREAEALKSKLEHAEKKASDARDQLLRTAAEYDNFRKRSAREADQKFNDGVAFAVQQILDILDTLDRAANTECADENYKKGVTMTLDKAEKALATLKVEEIEAEGKPFDPNVMSAVQQVPAAEGQESGTVVTVYQKGYRIGERIVRHATVVVAE